MAVLTFAIACGGGGSSGSSTSVQEIAVAVEGTSISKISIYGKVDFPEVALKVSFSKTKSKFGDITFKNISSGEVFITSLNSDGSYALDVVDGNYEVTAQNSNGQVVKAIFIDVAFDAEEKLVNQETSVSALYILSLAEFNLNQWTSERLSDEVKKTMLLVKQVKGIISQTEISSELRGIALRLMSIESRFLDVNRTGNSDLLLSTESIKSQIINPKILEPIQTQVVNQIAFINNVEDNSFENSIDENTTTSSTVDSSISTTVPTSMPKLSAVTRVPKTSLPVIVQMSKQVTVGKEVSLEAPDHLKETGFTYNWQQIFGKKVALSNPETSLANFNMPVSDTPLFFKLSVFKAGVFNPLVIVKVENGK